MNINAQNDKEVEKLEKKLRAVYLRAQTETQAKMEDYLQRFATKDAIKQEQVKQGKITQEEYINWRKGQIAVGKLWQDKVDALAADYTNANRIAMGIVRGDMAGTFATNHNYAAYQLEHDTMLNLSFSLYDQNTLANLVKNNPDMLPLPSVDIPKDLRWNKQKINAVIIQAVLQGDSIPKIAQSLRKVSDMNYKAAVRNARTSMTAAQNAGRVESYKHAQDMGINLEQEWLATLDGRTRHSHRQMDGERIAVAKDKWHPAKFSNGCRYPGDPNGPPWEIYNCRCTLVAAIKGIDQSNAPRNSKLGGMSYEEWKNEHAAQTTQTVYTDKMGGSVVNDIENDQKRADELQKELEELAARSQELFMKAMQSGDLSILQGEELTQLGEKTKKISDELDSLKAKISDSRMREGGHLTQKDFFEALPVDYLEKRTGDGTTYKEEIGSLLSRWSRDGYSEMKNNPFLEEVISLSSKKFNGEKLYRGLDLDNETLAALNVGSEFKPQGLNSWSTNMVSSLEFAYENNNPVLVMDKTKGERQAVSIKAFSSRTFEDEILYSGKVSFRVVNRSEQTIEYKDRNQRERSKRVTVIEVEAI